MAFARHLRVTLLVTSMLLLAGVAGYPVLGEKYPQLLCKIGSAEHCAEASLRAFEREDRVGYVEYSTKACTGGFATGCSNLGVAFEHGFGVDKDLVRARDYYERACQAGSMLACRNLGNVHLRGLGVAADRSLAERYLRQACDGESGAGCNDLGRILPDTEESWPARLDLFEKACMYGDRFGCSNLAFLLSDPKHRTERGLERAAQLASDGCLAGHPQSCVAFGDLLLGGLGTQRAPALARQRYQFACDSGAAGGCRRLGLMYDQGEGVPKDVARAQTLIERACELEDASACLYVVMRLAQDWSPQASKEERERKMTQYLLRAEELKAGGGLTDKQ